MSQEYGTTRWWENYLVRYLMPSIAGVVIVNWLCSYGGNGLRLLLFLPTTGERLDATSLTLLFLYGNLFCYVASYPVLVFHVTRVMDFSDGKWRAKPLDGYIATIVLTAIAFGVFHYATPELHYWLAFLMVVGFVAIQLTRIGLVFFRRIRVQGTSGTVSPAYGYAYALARRRGIPAKEETDESPAKKERDEASNTDDLDDEGLTTVRRDAWRQEYMDTYRHLREHGNSAFIFLLEIALASLTFCIITKPGQLPAQQLGAIGTLFAVWALPATFVHLLGQHLERRFSHFDRRVGDTAPIAESKPAPPTAASAAK
jgi:hypothetical protein